MLGLRAGVCNRLLGGGARLGRDPCGLLARVREDALTLAQALVGLAVELGDRGQRLVARALGLGARGVQDLLGLLLGRLDAVLGGAVGLGDALARARLGLLAQLARRCVRRLR